MIAYLSINPKKNNLNCRILSLPFKYLGIPIGDNPRRSVFWDPIFRKCEGKLATWKHRHISFGGRVILINSVLTAIPIYFLFFQGPVKSNSKTGSHSAKIPMGRRSGPKEDRLG